MSVFVFTMSEEKRRTENGALRSRKNKIRNSFLLYAGAGALSSKNLEKRLTENELESTNKLRMLNGVTFWCLYNKKVRTSQSGFPALQ